MELQEAVACRRHRTARRIVNALGARRFVRDSLSPKPRRSLCRIHMCTMGRRADCCSSSALRWGRASSDWDVHIAPPVGASIRIRGKRDSSNRADVRAPSIRARWGAVPCQNDDDHERRSTLSLLHFQKHTQGRELVSRCARRSVPSRTIWVTSASQ